MTGTLASEYLIGQEEQQRRQAQMKAVCRACHSTSWVNGHFRKMANTGACLGPMRRVWLEKNA